MPPTIPINNKKAKLMSVIAATLSEATPKVENKTTATLSRSPKPPREIGRKEIIFTIGIKIKK